MLNNRRRLVLACLAVLVAIILAVWLVPSRGYDFPSTSDIATMEALLFNPHGDEQTFMVPSEFHGDILSALSPSRYDAFPKKWQALGDLEIRTKDGKSIHVDLYDVGDLPVGAFAAGPTSESRAYYRGGNSARLRSALERAHAESAKH